MGWTNEQKLAHYHQVRRTCIKTLGNQCACCHETEYDFLQIDHIKDDGAAHRRQAKTTGGLVLLLDVLKQPNRYQVLCANCHLVKSKGLVCPHKR